MKTSGESCRENADACLPPLSCPANAGHPVRRGFSAYMRPPLSRVFRWCLAISIAFGYGCCARSSPAAAKRCAEDAGLEGAPHPLHHIGDRKYFLFDRSCVCLSCDFVPIQGEPFACVRRSPHQLISGRVQPVPRSLMRIARARGSKGDGTILYRGVFQPCRDPVTHPPWIS